MIGQNEYIVCTVGGIFEATLLQVKAASIIASAFPTNTLVKEKYQHFMMFQDFIIQMIEVMYFEVGCGNIQLLLYLDDVC